MEPQDDSLGRFAPLDSAQEMFNRRREGVLATPDHDQAQCAFQADLFLDLQQKFLSAGVWPRRCEWVLRLEAFAKELNCGAHTHHRHALVAILREQPRLHEFAPGDDLAAARLKPDDRRIRFTQPLVALKPPSRCPRM